jgi:bacteriocin biosynthesis cyclodehydratase domain-containing protein
MTRSTVVRPTLLPGLVRLWRDRHTLQIGLDPYRAVLLELADPGAVRLLDLLDGAHSERAVLERAAALRVDPQAARTLIDTLHTTGLVVGGPSLLPRDLPEPTRRRLSTEAVALALRGPDRPTPAQVLRRRATARVVLTGQGRLAAPVAVALAQAGVGHVVPDLAGRVEPGDLVGTGLVAADLRRPRAEAVAEAVERAAPGTGTRPAHHARVALTVQVGTDRPATLLAARFAQRRQAHLLLGLRDGTAVVGPLVRPGAGACLNCLDLHRRDRDPAWPELAAQLAAGSGPEPCGIATLLTAVGYATAEVLTHLDGGTPETLGAAVEIAAPSRIRRRAWPPHPGCGCVGRPGPRSGTGHPRTGVTPRAGRAQ